jgi:hypothetical protein
MRTVAQEVADFVGLVMGDKHLANRARRRQRPCADPRATKKCSRKAHVLITHQRKG